MEKYLYTIIDNVDGVKYETNNWQGYKRTLEDLKENYTTINILDVDKLQVIPNYIITTNNAFDNDKVFTTTYIDIKE